MAMKKKEQIKSRIYTKWVCDGCEKELVEDFIHPSDFPSACECGSIKCRLQRYQVSLDEEGRKVSGTEIKLPWKN
jgi:hypothetical protein